MRVINPSDFLSEEEVLKRWPMLSRSELRKARRANPPKIGFYAFAKKTGGPCYTPEQVQAYIDATYLRAGECKKRPDLPSLQQSLSSDSSSEDTISTGRIPTGAVTGMPAGMTPELAKSAAAAFKRQISTKPRSSSLSSSPPRHRAAAGG
jgi:hypothetical protein